MTNTTAYDSDLRPTHIAAVVDLAFSYDLANHITGITNRWYPSLTQGIGYDAMGRITTIASGVDNESYTYDANGNRTHKVRNGNPIAINIAANSNRLLVSTGVTYGFDADGNVLTANGNTLYHYDPFGRVDVGNGTWVYSVGAEGQRLREGGPATTYFAPDRSGVLLAENLSGTWQDYVYLHGKMVAVVRSGAVYSVHSDQVNRPLMLTNSAKEAVWEVGGLPFTTTPMINTFGAFNFGFPGQYEAHGHTHNGYREYNGYLGRYEQSDPIGLAGGINTYAYGGNNPISNIDPLGLIGYVCQKGNNVGINIPINFKGSTPAEISAMSQAIAGAWSGQFGQYNVVTTVTSVPSFNSAVNAVYVMQGRGQSVTENGNTGYWYTNGYYINGLDYAHEAGHLLGLRDEGPGSNSLMGNVSVGMPNEAEIGGVLTSSTNRCGCGN